MKTAGNTVSETVPKPRTTADHAVQAAGYWQTYPHPGRRVRRCGRRNARAVRHR